MYTQYLKITPGLPDDTSLWMIQLCSTFYNTLTNDLKDRIGNEGFKMLHLSNNHTKQDEISALRRVRQSAVESYKKLTNELRMMIRFISAQQNTKLKGTHLLHAALCNHDDFENTNNNPQLPIHKHQHSNPPIHQHHQPPATTH